jgi:hypothetical protein
MEIKKLNLLPYPSSIGSPKIDISDLELSKYHEATKINEYFRGKFSELLDEYEKLLEDFEINKKICESNYKFIPVIGNTYFLYEREDGSIFLSLIDPLYWNKKFICKVKYNSSFKWDLIKE